MNVPVLLPWNVLILEASTRVCEGGLRYLCLFQESKVCMKQAQGTVPFPWQLPGWCWMLAFCPGMARVVTHAELNLFGKPHKCSHLTGFQAAASTTLLLASPNAGLIGQDR